MFVNGSDQETAGALYFDTQLSIFITESVFFVNYKFFQYSKYVLKKNEIYSDPNSSFYGSSPCILSIGTLNE